MGKSEFLKDNRDELTGLLDKHAFIEWGQELINTRDKQVEYGFVFFDMENFKLYNANYGYEKGDELLISIGNILKDIFKNQLVARFSGDHFVVCTNSIQIVPSIVETRKRVKALQRKINIELKAGVYILEDDNIDVSRCVDRARMACVSIKKKYDIDYRFYDDELGGTVHRKQKIIDSLDEALEKGYIKVYYQPIVRSLTGNICGWEALVRWITPKGVYYPDEFIPVLEEYRMIHRIDCYVIEQVVKTFSEMKKAGIKAAVPVSVNLSRIDFETLDILTYVDSLIEKYDTEKEIIRLEVTESVMIDNPRFIQEQISRLRTNGYIVWMDDFGSGYSSLNLLKDFQFDLAKIDMEFLQNFDTSDNGKIVLKHAVSMLKNVGIHTLTEGVETKEQYDFLKRLGCELLQGYYIGRPLPLEESMEEMERSGHNYENLDYRKFLDMVGKTDFLRQNPLEGTPNNVTENDLPLAMGLVRNNRWRFAYANEGYEKAIKIHGDEDMQVAQDMINNDNGRTWVQRDDFWKMCLRAKESGEAESIEFVENGQIVNMRARHIAYDIDTDTDAYLVSIRALASYLNESYEQKTKMVSNYIFSFYECIDVFGLDGIYYENVYLSSGSVHVRNMNLKANEMIKELGEKRVLEEDREYFYKLMDLKTAKARLLYEPGGVKIGLFRILDSSGDYVWKSVTTRIVDIYGREALLSCVSEATTAMSHYMSDFINHKKIDEIEVNPEMVKDYTYANILDQVPVGVFWKDKDRRFLGANKMFLDYYGLKSVDSIKGKNDEDMGWHINPEPFKQDELSVINEGKAIRNVHGECIVRGELRNIAASKQPLVINGETAGLLGFFMDITDNEKEKANLEILSTTDELTGVLNRRAFEVIIDKYIEQYNMDKTDFALMIFDVDKFKHVNDHYGHGFGDLVLKAVSKCVKEVTYNNSLAFRIGGDEFAILHQFQCKEEIESITQEFNSKISRIKRIDNEPIKIKVSVGVSAYTESMDKDRMYELSDKRMYEDKLSEK
ncbi:diguanylate cyclase (GGDEF) domain-containing protein [Pseudobutyrivibrio sp. C4]|uniref:EAL domain-containing protein n=1 Tax=Pseudobutyrivibrio sp. C4 TaxID=1520803 RepID=UPI0008BBE5CA|nr:EAL domain-containing protein [Pseudobutyrivibrio sp. C4]SET13255.1 diguanylate cyclase (GGDEF) domain-containing protein [Pseudobutyrivibrio sp. C4]